VGAGEVEGCEGEVAVVAWVLYWVAVYSPVDRWLIGV
jgi:hypothetical protein